jgi:hypothetical protein
MLPMAILAGILLGSIKIVDSSICPFRKRLQHSFRVYLSTEVVMSRELLPAGPKLDVPLVIRSVSGRTLQQHVNSHWHRLCAK